MNPVDIIEKYYKKGSLSYNILMEHSLKVAEKSVKIGKNLNSSLKPDEKFLYEAAVLHDIGILKTNAPDLGCFGDKPYICHGILGSQILEQEGFPKHALVCERHTGTGLSKEEIIEKNLPLPHKDMLPVSIEEEIICYADKFFSKNPKQMHIEKTPEQVGDMLKKFGEFHLKRFKIWHKKFAL